jgi:hypothetical protein
LVVGWGLVLVGGGGGGGGRGLKNMVDRLLRIDYQHFTSWGTNKMMLLFIK